MSRNTTTSKRRVRELSGSFSCDRSEKTKNNPNVCVNVTLAFPPAHRLYQPGISQTLISGRAAILILLRFSVYRVARPLLAPRLEEYGRSEQLGRRRRRSMVSPWSMADGLMRRTVAARRNRRVQPPTEPAPPPCARSSQRLRRIHTFQSRCLRTIYACIRRCVGSGSGAPRAYRSMAVQEQPPHPPMPHLALNLAQQSLALAVLGPRSATPSAPGAAWLHRPPCSSRLQRRSASGASSTSPHGARAQAKASGHERSRT